MTCVNTTSYQFGRMCMVSFFALCLLFDLGGFLCFALLCLKSIHDDDTQHKYHHPVTASKWFRLVRCTKNFSFRSIFFAISILENETKIDTQFPRSLAPFDSAVSIRRCFQLHAMEHERSHVSMSYQRHTHTHTLYIESVTLWQEYRYCMSLLNENVAFHHHHHRYLECCRCVQMYAIKLKLNYLWWWCAGAGVICGCCWH